MCASISASYLVLVALDTQRVLDELGGTIAVVGVDCSF
jgi:hypothetical protein